MRDVGHGNAVCGRPDEFRVSKLLEHRERRLYPRSRNALSRGEQHVLHHSLWSNAGRRIHVLRVAGVSAGSRCRQVLLASWSRRLLPIQV